MITQAESGLSPTQYQLLQTQRFRPTYKAVLSLYYPQLEMVYDHGLPLDTIPFPWDADVNPMGIYRARGGQIFKWDGSTWDVIGVYAWDQICNPSFLYSNGTLYLYYFYYSSGAGYIAYVTIDGETVSSETILQSQTSFSGVYNLSASREHRVFALRRHDSDKNNSRIYVVTEDGIAGSDVYWSHVINGFGAAQINEEEDCVFISTPFPTMPGLRAKDATVSLVGIASGGTCSFIYKHGKFSDHFEIEKFDESNIWCGRYYSKIKRIGEYLFATCAGMDGSSSNYAHSIQIYRSRDGRYWEQPLYIATDRLQAGAVVGLLGDNIYLVGQWNMFGGDSTDYFGHISPAVQTDISSYLSNYSRGFGQSATGSVTAANERSLAKLQTILGSGDNLYMLQHYWGFYHNGVPVPYLAGVDEIDVIGESTGVPNKEYALSFSDRMSWLTTSRIAYEVFERELWIVGADDFEDSSTTGYGGLRHTATQTGSWKTQSNQLILVSKNTEGVAFSTYKTNIWNGSIRFAFQISDLPPVQGTSGQTLTPPSGSYTLLNYLDVGGNISEAVWNTHTNPDVGTIEQYVGVVFKAYDKDNLWFLRYRSDEVFGTRWELGQRIGGVETIHVTEDEILPLRVWHYIQVSVRYNKVTFYRSVDGVTWELFELDGQPYYVIDASSQLTNPMLWKPGISLPIMVESGSMGYMGRGWSYQDEWDTSALLDLPILPPVQYTFGSLPTYDIPSASVDFDTFDPGEGVGRDTYNNPAQPTAGSGVVYVNNPQVVAYTENFSAYSPEWNEVVSAEALGDSKIMDFVIDPFCEYMTNTGDKVGMYVLTNAHVFHCPDVHEVVPTWTEIYDTGVNEYTIIRAFAKVEGQVAIYCPSGSSGSSGTVDVDVVFTDNVFTDGILTVTRQNITGSSSNQIIGVDTNGSHKFIIEFATPTKLSKLYFDWINWQYHVYGWKGVTMQFYTAADPDTPVEKTGPIIVNSKNQPDSNAATPRSAFFTNQDVILHQNHYVFATTTPLSKIEMVIDNTFYNPPTGYDNPATVSQLHISYQGVATGRAQVTVIDRITPQDHTKVFGNDGNTSTGMDVDDYDIDVIRAAANGKIYGTPASTDIFTSEMELKGSEYSWLNKSDADHAISAVRVWQLRMNRSRNSASTILHGSVGFKVDSSTSDTPKIRASWWWTEEDFATVAWYYSTTPPASIAKWSAGYILADSPNVYFPAGHNGIETWGSNPAYMVMVGIDQEEYENPTDSRIILVTQNAQSKNVVTLNKSLGGVYFMATFSPRKKENVYICGKDGILYLANKTVLNKTGDFASKFGYLDLIKIQPKIRIT